MGRVGWILGLLLLFFGPLLRGPRRRTTWHANLPRPGRRRGSRNRMAASVMIPPIRSVP